ncbi:MAG: methyltransferase domain-containing protein [Thermoanaerobaculia bacterium]|nr:MAG: methyltransferase domain-containing protein [Thermoanaerobaculia bacterium]
MDVATSGSGESGARRALLDLFLISLLALFAELVVIRWLASEIRVFAYLKNLPLLASFFGLGLGCALPASRRFAACFPPAFAGLALVIAWAGPLGLVHLRFPDPSVALWSAEAAPSGLDAALFLFVVFAVFAWVVAAFAALGVRLGALFDGFPPLTAYSVNVAGSLAGIALYSGLSLAATGPAVWLAIVAALSLRFEPRWAAAAVWAAGLGLVLLAPRASAWSPYYRIDTEPLRLESPRGDVPLGLELRVNHDYHQRALDLSPALLESHPWLAGDEWLATARLAYDLPHRVVPSARRVLVVGAGTGNDVAAALRHGAERVDAVEIDPKILEIGTASHPERPYSSPAVTVTVDDARAVFRRSGERYDLIVFGLLDSHTMFSSLSSLRLDNYVYTVESFREAVRLLKPEGVLSVSFSVAAGDWIGHRLANTLAEATGREPVAVRNGYDVGVTFFAGPGSDRLRTDGLDLWSALDAPGRAAVRPATDDWPFLYIRPRSRPTAYAVTLGVILLGALAAVRRTLARGVAGHGFDAHLFFMGAAFMLVETKCIAELSLLFGSTWSVNAAVFAGILVMILGANALVARAAPRRVEGWFLGLAAALVLPLLLPLVTLNELPFGARAALGALLVSLPILFAGVVFATSFRGAAVPSAALASNLFGALVGGVLEYGSMFFGIRSLNLLALAVYTVAYLALRFRRRPAALA